MSRTTSPAPVYLATTAVPQQLTDDSVEVVPTMPTSYGNFSPPPTGMVPVPTGSVRISAASMFQDPRMPATQSSIQSSLVTPMTGAMPPSMGNIPVTLPPRDFPPRDSNFPDAIPTLPPRAFSPPTMGTIPGSEMQMPSMGAMASPTLPASSFLNDPASQFPSTGPPTLPPSYWNGTPGSSIGQSNPRTIGGLGAIAGHWSHRPLPMDRVISPGQADADQTPEVAAPAEPEEPEWTYENSYVGQAHTTAATVAYGTHQFAGKYAGEAADSWADTVEGSDAHGMTERFCDACGRGVSGLFGSLGKAFGGSGDEDPEEAVDHLVKDAKGSRLMMFLGTGLFVTSMLAMIPIWDGFKLWDDPAWMYMEGSKLPYMLMGFVGYPLLFVITVISLATFSARPQHLARHQHLGPRSEQTLVSVAILFTLLLGAMLLSVSEPLRTKAIQAETEFGPECQYGLRTSPLYAEQLKLQKIRDDPSCAKKDTVEKCKGFEESDKSSTLRDFEQYYQCSGFCWHPPTHVENGVKTQTVIVKYVTARVQMQMVTKKIEQQKKALAHLQYLLKTMTKTDVRYKRIELKIKFLKGEMVYYQVLHKKILHLLHTTPLHKTPPAAAIQPAAAAQHFFHARHGRFLKHALLEKGITSEELEESEESASDADKPLPISIFSENDAKKMLEEPDTAEAKSMLDAYDSEDNSALDASNPEWVSLIDQGEDGPEDDKKEDGKKEDDKKDDKRSPLVKDITVYDTYPKTLFGPVQLYGSCSFMAGVQMHGLVHDMGRQLMWEGLFLVGAAVTAGLMMIAGVVKKQEPRKAPKSLYGSMQSLEPDTAQNLANSDVRFRGRP